MVRLLARVTLLRPTSELPLSVERLESAGEVHYNSVRRLKPAYSLKVCRRQAQKSHVANTNLKRVASSPHHRGAVRDMIIAFADRFPLTELTSYPR